MVGIRGWRDVELESDLERRTMWILRGSARPRCLLAELAPAFMDESPNHDLQRAISTISHTDPIVKLLREVLLGRKRPDDAGLRAVTDAWLATYRQVLETSPTLDHGVLRRLDPSPRLAVLIEAGVLDATYPAVRQLQEAFARRLVEVDQS